MGCDIHAMIEVKGEYGWINAGDPQIGRWYELFSVLGNVRNSNHLPYIQDSRGKPEDCSIEFDAFLSWWGSDAHSTGWVSLEELINCKFKNKEVLTDLIVKMAQVSKDNKDRNVRLCFFFDN